MGKYPVVASPDASSIGSHAQLIGDVHL